MKGRIEALVLALLVAVVLSAAGWWLVARRWAAMAVGEWR